MTIFHNPFTIWLKWYFKSQKILLKERGKHLKIGYMTYLNDVSVGKYLTLHDNITISNSRIDDFVYVGGGTRILNTSIGKFCSIGPDVKIGLGKHPAHFISTFPAFFSTQGQGQFSFADKNYFTENGPIQIGNDVWIGANVVIMDDVIIGDGAIIATGAIVTKNVEPYSIVAGVPAHVLKKRFTDEEIGLLLNLKWWDKDFIWLKENFHSFNNSPEFFQKIIKDSI